jgi:molybdate transport system substrate-binding protein
MLRTVIMILLSVLSTSLVRAEPLRAATAANFAPALGEIVARFAAAGGGPVEVIVGSTGRLYAQIVNGAPFDLFFAADAERPARLVAEGLARPEDRFPYVVGRLVLWSPDALRVDPEGGVLSADAGSRLAVANPRLAPYGRAALETLEALGLASAWAERLVVGESVAQALQFVESGNAELGLVALSLLGGRGGSRWVVPDSLHAPIEQHAVVLVDSPAARALIAFLATDAVVDILLAHGYALPETAP